MKMYLWLYTPQTMALSSAIGGLILCISGSFTMQYSMVSDWLFEDSKLKKKLRRTKKEVFKELQGHGFEGSYRTVCYFISEWESNHNDTHDRGYERLAHPPSKAQVDFGVMEAVKDGEFVDVHALVMSYPCDLWYERKSLWD